MAFRKRFHALTLCSALLLGNCVETDFTENSWTMSPGDQLNLGDAQDWTLDVVRLEVPTAATYALRMACSNGVKLTLYRDADEVVRWNGASVVEALTPSSTWHVVIDRSSEPDCEGPFYFEESESGVIGANCTTDAECGAYICDSVNGACLTNCTNGSECTEPFQCDLVDGSTVGQCVGADANPYSWVALVSTAAGGDATSADNPGPDVDAIELRQGAANVYASVVVSSAVGLVTGGDNSTGSPTNVIGAPDDFMGPNQDCALESATGYFSFGGSGGFIAVSFSGVTEIGSSDVIKVYEIASGVGNCGNVVAERPDTFDVYVGRGAAPATAGSITTSADTCRQGSSPPLGGITEVTVNTATCN